MTFEEAKDMAMLYSIDPSLTCSCDEVHVCQQCSEEYDDAHLLYQKALKDNLK